MPKHDVSVVKWLITAGTVTGTLAGWMTLASGASAAATGAGSDSQSNSGWDDLLQNPFPTLASPFRSAENTAPVATVAGQSAGAPQPTLRSVKRPTVVYVPSGGSGGRTAPVTSTRTSKKK